MSKIELYTAPWDIMIEIIGFGPIETGENPEQPLMILENTMLNDGYSKSSPFLACYGKGSEKKPDIDFSKRNFIVPYDEEYHDFHKLFRSFCTKSYHDILPEIILHLGTDDWDSERFLTWKHFSNEDLLKLGIEYDDFIRIRKSNQIRKRKLLEKNNISIPRKSIFSAFRIQYITRDSGSPWLFPKKYPTLDQQEGNPDAW